MTQIDGTHPNAITAYFQGLRATHPDWVNRPPVLSTERAIAQAELQEHLQGTTPEGQWIRTYYATVDQRLRELERPTTTAIAPAATGRDNYEDKEDENGDEIECRSSDPDLLDTSN